jgi:hypothetical protein
LNHDTMLKLMVDDRHRELRSHIPPRRRQHVLRGRWGNR